MKRISLALIAVAVTAVSLTGCSTSSSPTNQGLAACSQSRSSSTIAEQINVSGSFDTKPTVTFSPGLSASNAQARVAIAGAGHRAQAGESVSVDAALYNGSTGKLLQSTAYDGKTRALLPVDTSTLGGLAKVIECQQAGSRVVAVVGADKTLNSSLGLSTSSTVVVVLDIVRVNLAKADGTSQIVPDGLPRVVLAENGTPGITVPNTSAPTKLTVAVLKKGSGATVPAHADVTVHYVGVTWAQGTTPFDSSWSRGTPADFSVDGVVAGFRDAIVGQTVGSQVLVIIPPALGYGSTATGSIPANSTLVFVIDILGSSN